MERMKATQIDPTWVAHIRQQVAFEKVSPGLADNVNALISEVERLEAWVDRLLIEKETKGGN